MKNVPISLKGDAVVLPCLNRLYLGIGCGKSMTPFLFSFLLDHEINHVFAKNEFIYTHVMNPFHFYQGKGTGSFGSFCSWLAKEWTLVTVSLLIDFLFLLCHEIVHILASKWSFKTPLL